MKDSVQRDRTVVYYIMANGLLMLDSYMKDAVQPNRTVG